MAVAAPPRLRVSVDGKFFRLGEKKFYVKGVSYGPFAADSEGEPFADADQTARDFAHLQELGANLIRVYAVPPRWLLDLAFEYQLRLLIDIPWNKHLCFLDSPEHQKEVRAAVREAVSACARHPAVFAFSVANAIPDFGDNSRYREWVIRRVGRLSRLER